MAFRLNFSPDVITKAKASRRGVFATLRDRIRDALKKAFGSEVLFWCALDTTEAGRLHIQGGLIVGDNFRERATEALGRAGGRWGHTHSRDKQTWLGKPSYLDQRWASYSVRHTEALERETGQGAVYASASIKRQAEALYAGERQSLIKFQRSGDE
ncbi:MAG: hypothetical protein ACK4S3_06455 [Parvibaculum sp.]